MSGSTLRSGSDLDAVRKVADELCRRADWRRVIQVYKQLSSIAEDESAEAMPRDVPSDLAEHLARTFASYEGREEEFIADLLALFSTIDGVGGDDRDRFRYVYRDLRLNRFVPYRDEGKGRRRPKPFEASVETVRRIMDLNRIRDVSEKLPTSAVLGGSLSYGRFYNTSGGQERPSDTDLLVVLPEYECIHELAAALSALEFVDPESLRALTARSRTFLELRLERPRCAFLHKLRLWEDPPSPYLSEYQVLAGHYQLALHVFDQRDFDYLILRDCPIIGASGSEPERRIFEYREAPPPRGYDEFRNFSGHKRSIDLSWSDVDGGVVVDHLVYDLTDDRFSPGTHMNLILPRFEVRWEAPEVRIRLTLLAFEWKILARLADENRMRDEVLRLTYSHPRSDVFSPHVAKAIDGS